jgi:hypothetical protein
VDPDSFECIGYNSWGFAEAAMAGYTPAAASLNMVSCTYVMHPYGEFKVPRRMKALWRLNAKQIKVLKRLNQPFMMECTGQNVTSPSQDDFCTDKVQRMKFSCDTTWMKLAKATAKSCTEAPAPDGFRRESTLQELCPKQCGWEKNTVRWPPYPTSEEKKAAEEAKAKAKAEGSS